jgi:hypothetical protein
VAWLTARTTFVGGDTALAQAFMDAVKPRFATAAREMSQDSKDLITDNAPVGNPSGERSEPLSSRDNYVVTITEVPQGFVIEWTVRGSGAFMAKFHAQNTGSSSHVITKAGKPPMPWRDNDGDAWGFGFKANHPGTTGTHFYDDAIEEVIDRVQQYFD